MVDRTGVHERELELDLGTVRLRGDLVVPADAQGVVAFAHGSGSSRHSPRNRFVAEAFNGSGLGTLLFDLLTPDEERIDLRTRHLRFDIELLAGRLAGAVDWLGRHLASGSPAPIPIGLFGASTGAAAALIAAAERPYVVGAVVSRGGRPDLAGSALPRVQAPTLLIVGGADVPVIGMNRAAAEELRCPHRVEIVPGATHLFEEPGKLEAVADLAQGWFLEHLRPGARR